MDEALLRSTLEGITDALGEDYGITEIRVTMTAPSYRRFCETNGYRPGVPLNLMQYGVPILITAPRERILPMPN